MYIGDPALRISPTAASFLSLPQDEDDQRFVSDLFMVLPRSGKEVTETWARIVVLAMALCALSAIV